MPIERTFQDLSTQLRKLHDTFLALRLTVVEDKPLKGDAALVDQLEDSILDQMGLLDEGRKAAEGALKAVGHPLDLSRARLALTICQERFHGIEQQFTADLVSYEKLKERKNNECYYGSSCSISEAQRFCIPRFRSVWRFG